jgi:hypothetical protein
MADPVAARACHKALLADLALPRSALAACRRLGLTTVGEFLDCTPVRFVHEGGASTRAHALIDREVRDLMELEAHRDKVAALPLEHLQPPGRTLRALLAAGITTIGGFLATPAAALAAAGLTPPARRALRRQVLGLAKTATPTPGPVLLPEVLLRLPVAQLSLPAPLAQALQHHGHDLGSLLAAGAPALAADPQVGVDGVGTLRLQLERTLRAGLDQLAPVTGPLDLQEFLDRLTRDLSAAEADWLRRRIGVGGACLTRRELARQAGLGEPQARLFECNLRRALHQRASDLLAVVERETRAELRAFEGVVTAEHLAAGSTLGALAAGSKDPLPVLRLIAFCLRRGFHLDHDVLTTVPGARVRRASELLRRLTHPKKLPVTLAALEQELAGRNAMLPRGMLLHVLRARLRLHVALDPRAGEVIDRRLDCVAHRLETILKELDREVSLEDLLFHYRDRHQRAHKGRLLDHLTADPRFLQVGKDLWTLRSRHQGELEIAAAEAERLRRRILETGGRHSIEGLVAESRPSDRALWLLIDCLKRDPLLHALGKGEFCPADRRASSALLDLQKAMRRAMGELPLQRFLANQTPRRRRLVQRLLRDNRAFIEPTPDRIDVLSNYPFNAERLAGLLETVREHLRAHRGYAPIADLVAAVNAADLGGSFLSEHMLRDLLRRHSRCELLPGDLVAEPNMGLGAWIQQRAREAIRLARLPLSVPEILETAPELAGFGATLTGLLGLDPLVQSKDGQRFVVV